MTDPEPTTPEQPEDPNADGGGSGPGQPAPVTFTQEQLDAIVKDRLARSTAKTQTDLLAQLGIEDVETAKKTLAEADEARKAQMSELEKAQAEIAEAKAEAEKATAEAEIVKAVAAEALLQAAVISQAGNLHKPTNAWHLMDKSKIKTNEDGTYEGIDEAIKALIEEQPHLAKPDNGGQGPGTPARPKPQTIVEKMLAKQQATAPKTAEELRPNISY